MDYHRLSQFILRLGVAFAFLYPPINAITNPFDWIGYFPPFMHGILSDMLMLHLFGIIEVIIAVWILIGRDIFWPSLAAFFLLVAIVLFNMNNFVVIFRDLSIAAAALALAIAHIPPSIARSLTSKP